MKKLFSQKPETHYDTFIGKYYKLGALTVVVDEVIAEGGFSYVFLVRELSKNKQYALKRMLVNSQTDLDNCKREIGIMKQFHRHRSIVPFRGHHTKHTGNGIYEILLLMQHCPNGTVIDKMNDSLSEGFSEEVVLSIFSGIVDAVALMHDNDICHRDLKAENILIGPNKEYVLCDFGSAIKGTLDPEVDGHTTVEENINRFTTMAYRAPEMIDMYLGYKIGSAADCWALGVLLYKLCFFTTPFEENALAIVRAKYSIPSESRYSTMLISVIRDTLKPNPSDRLTALQITARLKGQRSRHSSSTPCQQSAHQDEIMAPQTVPTQQPELVKQNSEENAVIKPRQRPRGHVTQATNERLIKGPPVLRTTISPSSSIVESGADHVTRTTDHVTAKSPTSDPESIRVQRHSVHNLPASTAEDTIWGSAQTITSPQGPGMIIPRQRPSPLTTSTSQLLLLPPPPTSPSHTTNPRRARGHSRAKSDTTFLKNFNSPSTNPFLGDVLIPCDMARQPSFSSSTGHLSAGEYHGNACTGPGGYSNHSSAEMLNRSPLQHGAQSPLYSSSEVNFASSGWSTNPFNPPYDEFLKLSLRDKSTSGTEQPSPHTPASKLKKSPKVSRAQTPSHDRGQWLSKEQLLSPSDPETDRSISEQSNSGPAMTTSNETLILPPALYRATSEDAGRSTLSGSPDTGHINRGMSLTSLTSPKSLKKKKKMALFGKKKHASADEGPPHFSIVSNPLHDNFNT